MKAVKLFVEGGGDSHALRTECRAAFSSFLQKAGFSGHMPRIVASGSVSLCMVVQTCHCKAQNC